MSPVLAPVAAPSFDFARTLPTLEVVALAAVSPQTSTQRATVRVEPPRAQRLHDVGRYTLFSSLLL